MLKDTEAKLPIVSPGDQPFWELQEPYSQPKGYKSQPASSESTYTASGTGAEHITFPANREAGLKDVGTTLVNTSLFTDFRQKSGATDG